MILDYLAEHPKRVPGVVLFGTSGGGQAMGRTAQLLVAAGVRVHAEVYLSSACALMEFGFSDTGGYCYYYVGVPDFSLPPSGIVKWVCYCKKDRFWFQNEEGKTAADFFAGHNLAWESTHRLGRLLV